ncbi:hypothetical protein K2173_015743 [Erythroxylum novogranatense]|uniref:Uncharacterized protein n=1 Tax=Erythroxylum novogranatense TaxID=1862640 RepID=A0AAV8TG95_9ROSI|nr:hypothetical protein K2173_015743 [Erythroxylum novogranatense]
MNHGLILNILPYMSDVAIALTDTAGIEKSQSVACLIYMMKKFELMPLPTSYPLVDELLATLFWWERSIRGRFHIPFIFHWKQKKQKRH